MSYKNFEIQLNKELVDTDEKIEDVISLIAMDSLRGIVKSHLSILVDLEVIGSLAKTE